MFKSEVRLQDYDDNHAYAGRAVIITPHPDDEERVIGTLVSATISVAEHEIDDVSEADYAAEKAIEMFRRIKKSDEQPFISLNHSNDGIYLRATPEDITVSIPGADKDIDVAKIVDMTRECLVYQDQVGPDF